MGDSAAVAGTQSAKLLKVNISSGNVIVLAVTVSGSGIIVDHADWGNP